MYQPDGQYYLAIISMNIYDISFIFYIWLGSLPCSFLPSPVPANQAVNYIYYIIYFWWGPLILMPDPRSYLPSLVPVIAFHTNQLVNIISRLVKCILTQIVPKIVNI